MLLVKVVILFSASLFISSVLSDAVLISELNFSLNSSCTAAFADSYGFQQIFNFHF
jgi:hypothetical protein